MKRSVWGATVILGTALLAAATWAQETKGLLRFRVNPLESRITASVAEPMAMILGHAVGALQIISGEVSGNPNAIGETGVVKVVIDAASYKTDSDSRDQNVKEYALEVQEFPSITFESTKLSGIQRDDNKGGDDKAGRLNVFGKLTLHGVTKEIVVPVAVQLDSQGRLLADGTYTFKFEEHGVKRPSKVVGLMTTGDEAKIDFHIVADPV